jgi:hypothetical protein
MTSINKHYLESLGISKESVKGLSMAYNAIAKQERQINAELADALSIRAIAQEKEQEIAESLGLGLQNNQSSQWNSHFNCYQMTAQLEDKGSPTTTPEGLAYFTADGREIKTSIQLSASNTNFNPDDINTMFQDSKAAAMALAADLPRETQKQKYLKAIERVYAEFATEPGTMVRVYTPDSLGKKFGFVPPKFMDDSIEKIRKDFYEGIVRIEKNNVTDITNRTHKLNNLFINRLALEMARAKNNDATYVPESAKHLTHYVKMIRNKDIELHASKRRPILVNIYPCGVNQWIMRTYKPNSDEPSTRRQLEMGMFSNDLSGEIELIKKNADGTFQRIPVPAGKDRRSSSIAVLTHFKNKKEHDIELEKVYAAFKNMVIQYARDELIESVNAGKPISLDIVIKEAYITLLSPIKGHLAFSALPGVLTHENEYSQLKFTHKCLERIASETLKFSTQDQDYIMDHTQIKDEDRPLLQSINITHRSYFSNYIVNKYLGIHLEKFDLGTFSASLKNRIFSYKKPKNYRHFIKGNKTRQQAIIEFIKQDLFASANVQEQLIDMLKVNPIQDRTAFEILLKDKNIRGNLRILLETYLDIEKYFHGDSTGISKSRLVASYIMAAEDAILADILGYTAHHTCKSGIDRTGLLALIKEARLPVKWTPNAEQEFIQRLLTALQLGNSREIKTMNDPAARGLQIPTSVMTGHDEETAEIEQFLKDQNFNMLGKSKKHLFGKVTDDSFRDAKASARQADATPVITKPSRPPVQAKPPTPKSVVFTPKPPPPAELKKTESEKKGVSTELDAIRAKLRVVNPDKPRFPLDKT